MDRIHQSKITEIMERRTPDDRPMEFSLTYCKKSTGELVTYPRAVLTSVHSAGATVNVLPLSGETSDAPPASGMPPALPGRSPRKIRRCLITRINGMKVYF